jgi:hypothetical protein
MTKVRINVLIYVTWNKLSLAFLLLILHLDLLENRDVLNRQNDPVWSVRGLSIRNETLSGLHRNISCKRRQLWEHLMLAPRHFMLENLNAFSTNDRRWIIQDGSEVFDRFYSLIKNYKLSGKYETNFILLINTYSFLSHTLSAFQCVYRVSHGNSSVPHVWPSMPLLIVVMTSLTHRCSSPVTLVA